MKNLRSILPKLNLYGKTHNFLPSENRLPLFILPSVFLLAFLLMLPNSTYAASVRLAWNPSAGPGVTGYRIYVREAGQSYTYGYPDWEGATTACTISGLSDYVQYFFIARAYNGSNIESRNSNEVSFGPVIIPPSNSTFRDVPPGHWAEDAIDKIFSAGITKGCSQSPLRYCPEKDVSRAAMAVFLERGIHGRNFIPPRATGIFDDVPGSHWAAEWIEELYADGITRGCRTNPLMYCPGRSVDRAAMSVFLLRAKHGNNYTPPRATGIFSDVPVTHWAAGWIEQLYREGITKGCGTNPLQYCPDSAVRRDAMAVFLVRTFGL